MSACADCNCSLWFRRKCPLCDRRQFCSWCVNHSVVLPGGKAAVACRSCFRAAVAPFIDLSVAFEVHGPPVPGSAPTVVLVHGGGGSRAMYRPLALALVTAGFRCVLPDLPAHGGAMDEPLTIDTACAKLKHLAEQQAVPYHGTKPIYIGGSLGGYIGMELIGRHPDLFSAAVILCAEQTVGSGASLPAAAALGVMSLMLDLFMTSATMTGLMLGITAKHKFLDKELISSCSTQPGMYFHSGSSHCKLLRSCKSLEAMQRFFGPVCYIGGSLDHRDMAAALLNTSRKNEASRNVSNSVMLTRSICYEGGDHFFSHDTRFIKQFESDVVDFCSKVFSSSR
jgi:pimeloyl-ACP methyl ester carboxylesterase